MIFLINHQMNRQNIWNFLNSFKYCFFFCDSIYQNSKKKLIFLVVKQDRVVPSNCPTSKLIRNRTSRRLNFLIPQLERHKVTNLSFSVSLQDNKKMNGRRSENMK
ncbi:hypothetical protein BpHYR1_029532 [Brachionus plicatilis]|uniref:Uncharacterized protein n=1 Tax=Brachionus plicatilis TaxID=10195 RepID=A0A3M7P1C0_BRAPC|nr:hypothetical protein BpHYR1_029532 [Brachionus plicatilis]